MTERLKDYNELADELRRLIRNGTYAPGAPLPTVDALVQRYGLSRRPVREAIKVLVTEGLVNPGRGKRPTTVRDFTRIRIPFSRYSGVLAAGGSKGPWESALAAQGLEGEMKTVLVDQRPVGGETADLLGVAPGTEVVYRLRHACIADEVQQVQQAWYPPEVASQADLDRKTKITGGVYGALAESGLTPATATEVLRGRMPTREEATLMRTGSGVPLLTVERITRDPERRVLELLRVTAPADRIEFVYQDLPLAGGA
ncbi:GntR family transcriptional regulator [Streptomyces sp. DSM 44917]|uniref:GntR family transcriptional regulator n=1 Tax=Streptomyces boetiae TaxID=3075541 RepID=A0ABU2L3G2_9ACTN|nr:GntR family transcriptional regulator [Streptomyces sp. DSM 44917]MDT0306100.1 GntR family transcriptional regulator [Streptomyces sp. DSM 44917]